MTATVAGALRSALPAVIAAAIDDPAVQVGLGMPWPQTAQDLIAVGGVESQLEPGPMGPQRSRDETLTVEVLISVFRPGGQDQEQVASDRAYELLGAIERHLRMVDPTVGGLVRACLLTGHRMESDPFDDGTGMGRVVEVLATFAAQARIRD